jgi:signal peptidase II
MRLLIVILLIFLDFFSKKIIFYFIELNQLISIMPFIDITHIHNYGIAFGLFTGVLPLWFIVMLGSFMVIFLFFWMFRVSNNLEKWGILLIISGAIANIGDRLINNYVLDLILLHYKQYYWPAFNFADMYISVGVLIIILASYKVYKTKLKDKK